MLLLQQFAYVIAYVIPAPDDTTVTNLHYKTASHDILTHACNDANIYCKKTYGQYDFGEVIHIYYTQKCFIQPWILHFGTKLRILK